MTGRLLEEFLHNVYTAISLPGCTVYFNDFWAQFTKINVGFVGSRSLQVLH